VGVTGESSPVTPRFHDDGVVGGLTTSEQSELEQLRREKRRLEMENEILRRAAAYFAKDALPNDVPAGRRTRCPRGSRCARRRVFGFTPQAFYQWRRNPCSDRDLDDAYPTNALVDAHADDSNQTCSSPTSHILRHR